MANNWTWIAGAKLMAICLVLDRCSNTQPNLPNVATVAPTDDVALAEAAGAPLFAGMGKYDRPITTESRDAQRYFSHSFSASDLLRVSELARSAYGRTKELR